MHTPAGRAAWTFDCEKSGRGRRASYSGGASPAAVPIAHGSYLVDPASSHMLVSKIKPCMSKHKPLHGEAANGSLGHP
jgi:hypothetical protein